MEIDLPDEVYVGKGLAVYFRGWAIPTAARIVAIDLRIGERSYPANEIDLPRLDVAKKLWSDESLQGVSNARRLNCGFSGFVELGGECSGRTETVAVVASLSDGRQFIISEKQLRCLKEEEYFMPVSPAGVSAGNEPLVAICMASYSPVKELFARQVDSLRAQTHKNWICIISDDASDEKYLVEMRQVIGADRRFFLVTHMGNAGFYRNFEKALTYVPMEACFVAFADQDDYWYPEKVRESITALENDQQALLVYSDMRIVSRDGRVIADSYWVNRRNYFDDLALMLVANTVTGAASLFRRELLGTLLPFPQRIGDSFHDHVLACTALANGKIAYIDKPLYDYYQYEGNVLGHCDFQQSGGNRQGSFIARILHLYRHKDLVNRSVAVLSYYLAVYQQEYIRLALISKTLLLRGSCHTEDLGIFTDKPGTVFALLAVHRKVKRRKETTDDAEMRLLKGYLVSGIYHMACRMFGKFVVSFIKQTKHRHGTR